jgi:hypothetical protein
LTRTIIVGAIAFVGGVGVGLLVAKVYARQQVRSGLHDALNAVGLGGGRVEAFLSGVVVPQVV